MKVPSLYELLAYRRPADSKTERKFITRYLDTIPGMTADAYGNRIHVCPGAKTMISVHTDTVHRQAGMQRLKWVYNTITLHPFEKVSTCLGADDTAGIYAALRMIDAGVKATFVFHRGEEIGGKGSTWLAKNHREWVGTFNHCVALDRRGTQDIITHQGFGRCCSDEFAKELASALDMDHAPSEHGIFTDSANYVGIIPECTNVSAGYQHEHTIQESLDTAYLEKLIDALIAVKWDSLGVHAWTDNKWSIGESWASEAWTTWLDRCECCSTRTHELFESPDNMLVCQDCLDWLDADDADEPENDERFLTKGV